MKTISMAEIQAGDVLLFHGKGFVSWAIRKIDGSEVNHAAIAVGDGKLAEAGGHGLQSRAIPTASTDDDYMLVRRYPATDPLTPVVDTAEAYLAKGNFYAYQQIVLLAVLGLTRRIPARGIARRLIRSACDHAARALMDLLPVGASWMICSEYVYRCFDEAADADPDPYRILIADADYGGPVFGAESWLDWAEVAASDTPVAPPVAFGVESFDPDAAEAELAPLIAEWAAYAGVDEHDPLPVSDHVTFDRAAPLDAAAAAAAQADEVSDEQLQASMLGFAEALKVARGTAPGVPVSFGLMPATVAAAAVKGALKGLTDLTVDPNFVTPRDLFVSRSFAETRRAR